MNFYNLFAVSNWPYVLAYIVASVLLWKILRYIFGNSSKVVRIYEWTLGLPMLILMVLVYAVAWLVTWPYWYRNHRLLKDTFGITDRSPEAFDGNQILIYRRLSILAQAMDKAFDQEEAIRLTKDPEKMTQASKAAKTAKDLFWSTWHLAQKNGYRVAKKYSDYLPKV